MEERTNRFAGALERLTQNLIDGTDEVIEVPNTSSEGNPHRVYVIGGGSRLNADIAEKLVVCFLGTRDHLNPMRDLTRIPEMLNFARTCFTPDFRWSPLHLHLSDVGTKTKFESQQQRRKALHKFHLEKRVKKGRSHAKQKHKGIARYA